MLRGRGCVIKTDRRLSRAAHVLARVGTNDELVSRRETERESDETKGRHSPQLFIRGDRISRCRAWSTLLSLTVTGASRRRKFMPSIDLARRHSMVCSCEETSCGTFWAVFRPDALSGRQPPTLVSVLVTLLAGPVNIAQVAPSGRSPPSLLDGYTLHSHHAHLVQPEE
jgi:hypothetical protein